MPLNAALKLAKKERMDLMPVAPRAKPPVCRLGDANEAAKQQRLRERDSRRRELENRRKTLMKEASASLPTCSLIAPAPTRLPAAG
jgi:translation initiation factor IF-3